MKKILIAFLTLFVTHSLTGYSQTTEPLGKGLLWEISGNGLKKKSYLLGTIHLIPAKDYFFPKYYTKAVYESFKPLKKLPKVASVKKVNFLRALLVKLMVASR